MRLTDSSQDVLNSFTDNGGDWSEACLWLKDLAHDCAERGDREGLVVYRDMAFEIDAFMRSKRNTGQSFIDDGA